MLGCFKYPRSEIAKIIKKSPTTTDGIYVCKRFPSLNKALGGGKDRPYTFDRKYFDGKVCFTEGDLKAYQEIDPSYYNIYRMRIRDKYIADVIRKDMKKALHKKLDGNDYTLSELIDMTIFYFNMYH